MKKLPCQKAPCANCPFRKDTLKGWLSHRIDEIVKAESFVCHKNKQLQCAGHMILLKEENRFYQLAKRLFGSTFDLKNQDTVFESKDDCIAHHTGD